MELVRVLPSADDEVNVACFHPFAGGGLAYGTKVCFSFPRNLAIISLLTFLGSFIKVFSSPPLICNANLL